MEISELAKQVENIATKVEKGLASKDEVTRIENAVGR